MMKKRILVTGAGGLIGFETSSFFLQHGWQVEGVDNNLRAYFFGPQGDTRANVTQLSTLPGFTNHELDIRNAPAITELFMQRGPFDLIVHTAAQPSHDWAAKEPITDFGVNVVGTFNLLEAFRQHSRDGVFIFTSTNKVYGDNPNRVNLVETDTRFDYAPAQQMPGVGGEGISEEMSLDHCKHSLFGAGKTAADIYAQEYGRYFGLNVGVFRGGCLTGPQHSAVELHGFLTYIVHCAINGQPYRIIGYKGKQVRDQIHSFDVANAFLHFFQNPRKGEAYNLGGTKANAASILEVMEILKTEHGVQLNATYEPQARIGDHICYYTDMAKFKHHYPEWKLTHSLKGIIAEIVDSKRK